MLQFLMIGSINNFILDVYKHLTEVLKIAPENVKIILVLDKVPRTEKLSSREGSVKCLILPPNNTISFTAITDLAIKK